MAPAVKQPIAVVGGINADICGTPSGRLILRDSNPGHVSVTPGGVGRNIAHNLRLLGHEVQLMSIVGNDEYGHMLRRSCEELGIDTQMLCCRPDGYRTSTYLYVTDENGDMQTAVSDMVIMSLLGPDLIRRWLHLLNSAAAVVIDANLEPEAFAYIAANVGAPLYADPVSTVKAEHLAAVLPRLQCLKPNALEAEKLTGEHDPEKAAKALIRAGVKRVFLSMGAQGMLAAEGDRLLYRPCEQARVINTTGAGDAVTAALTWAGVHGMDLEDTLRFALRAGALTTECAGTTNPRLAELTRELL